MPPDQISEEKNQYQIDWNESFPMQRNIKDITNKPYYNSGDLRKTIK